MSTEKQKVGRPSKFDSINKDQFKELVLAGWDDKKISAFFKINVSTLTRWKQKHTEFCTALKDWKKEADLKVEKSLYKRAIGFQFDEIVYEKANVGALGIKLTGDKVKDIKAVETNKVKITTKLIIPDTTAQIFWLKNRQPDKWRDKKDVVVTELTKEERDAELIRLKALLSD